MSPSHATYRRVPVTFEAYLAQDDARPVYQALCDCCCETHDCWYSAAAVPNPDTICEACARRHHAFELAEEQKVRRLVTQLGVVGCRALIEQLDDMTVDDRVPMLVRGIATEIVTPAAIR